MNRVDSHHLLKENGLRATPQRLAVAGLLFKKPVHETAQSIYESLKKDYPSISHNTIYLTLSHFEEAGLIRRFHVDGRAVFDSNINQHDHAHCQSCNKLVDIPAGSAHEAPVALSSWSINQQTRVYSGICPDCIS